MSYEPTNWKTGDVVTSAKLNKLENAVANGGGVFIVHVNAGSSIPPVFTTPGVGQLRFKPPVPRTLETAGEIYQAVMKGNTIFVVFTMLDDGVVDSWFGVPEYFGYKENPSADEHKYHIRFTQGTFDSLINALVADDANDVMINEK